MLIYLATDNTRTELRNTVAINGTMLLSSSELTNVNRNVD